MPDLNDGTLTEERNISVVLINRYPLESIAIKSILEKKGVAVTGETISGIDALSLVDQLRPNAIIIDVDLPDIDGIELVETFRKRQYKGSIIVTSNKYEYFYSRCAANAGGNGFVSKKGSMNVIPSAVLVCAGWLFLFSVFAT
ncbi:response regulator [Klebsiella pneumoniae]